MDPLDGTTNFAHGYPCFCVSIALARRDSILDKLIVFHRDHDTSCEQALRDLKAAAVQLSPKTQTAEDPQLASELADIVVKCNSDARCAHKHGPRPLGDILLDVLIQRGFHGIESESAGE